MNGITERCIPLAQGAKDPLQRVNYEFGLVLGVDEFVAEQCYFLEKEHQHNRSLHGYGTVSGLHVTAAENGDDIEVRVSPGIGIDQYGRVFVVRNLQCASLPAWLADQDLDDGDDDETTIYVVARYAECETELVPIAGQPCSTSDQLSAASRLRDIYEIDFALEPPPQPRHDAVNNLAAFFSLFRVQAGADSLAALGDPDRLSAIIGVEFITQSSADFRTHLATELAGVIDPATQLIPVQPGEAEALLDDIFTYWITLVRPALLPDLIAPGAPAGSEDEPPAAEIILAQLTLATTDADALTLDDMAIDNSARPYLLHTHLLQALHRFPDMPGQGGDAAPAPPVNDFATIEDVSARSLSLWVHIDRDIELTRDNLRLVRIGANGALNPLQIGIREQTARRNGVGRYFQLNTRANLNNGNLLLLVFDADNIRVDGAGSLTDFITNAPFTYANFNPANNQMLAFHIVERAEGIDRDEIVEIITELIPPPTPIVPFVTITPLTVSDGGDDFLRNYELWFHLDGIVEQNDGGIGNLVGQENVFLFAETAPKSVDMVTLEPNRIRPNVWLANPSIRDRGIPFARFVFPLDADLGFDAYNPRIRSMDGFGSLRNFMEATGQRLDGHIMRFEELNDQEALVVYVREQGRAREVDG